MTAAIAAGRSFTLALLLFKQNTPLIQPFAGACRRRGGRRAEVKEPQDTAVENADLYRAADNAAHAITCIDSAMQSKRYWCIAERKRAFLHSNGTFRQVRMDAAPVPRRILQQIRLAMCPPPSATPGAGASLCNIARTVPAMPMSLWLRSIRERRLMTSFVRMSVENKVAMPSARLTHEGKDLPCAHRRCGERGGTGTGDEASAAGKEQGKIRNFGEFVFSSFQKEGIVVK